MVPIGSEPVFLFPHEEQYRILADSLELELDTLLAVAARYASEALAILPEQEAVREALEFSHMKHAYPYPFDRVTASRAAFGRVLADLTDARLLDDAPPHVHRLLRTVDIELLDLRPRDRPDIVPAPPAAGHDQTIERWLADIKTRLQEHITASTGKEHILIAAKSRLTVLNWGHLEEDLECGTTIGTDEPAEGRTFARQRSMTLSDLVTAPASERPENGEPLAVENAGAHWFLQTQADWLAFRPALAATLAWIPDPAQPGRWHTAAGDLAVETIRWVDGWPGHAGPEHDDTEADGHAVTLAPAGLAAVTAAFGQITRHFTLTRHGLDKRVQVEPMSVTRSLPVAPPTL